MAKAKVKPKLVRILNPFSVKPKDTPDEIQELKNDVTLGIRLNGLSYGISPCFLQRFLWIGIHYAINGQNQAEKSAGCDDIWLALSKNVKEELQKP